MSTPAAFAPAKINLFLAITGRRADGFHDLVSVVAQTGFGDALRFEPSDSSGFQLVCDDPALPLDDSNLVLRAARAHAAAGGGVKGGVFVLEKRIPVGAGLGGGSSDAAAALRLLNQCSPGPLPLGELAGVAASVGSDCPLFLSDRPVLMRGRGERIETLPPAAVARISGRRVLLFKPSFGISTPWAYGRLVAAAPGGYLPEPEAEERVGSWLHKPEAPLEMLLYNNMEAPAFHKYRALPVLMALIQERFGLTPRMSGSGSCCFVLLQEGFESGALRALISEAWGGAVFIAETRLA